MFRPRRGLLHEWLAQQRGGPGAWEARERRRLARLDWRNRAVNERKMR